MRPALAVAQAAALGGALLAALPASGANSSIRPHPPASAVIALAPTTADHLELERFMGLWYKVAKVQQARDPIRSRERYELMLRFDGTVRSIYTSYLPANNRWDRSEDFMEPVDRRGTPIASSQRITLPVLFRVPRFGPFAVTYELVALDPRYQWAVVKGPAAGALFVLSRNIETEPDMRLALEKLAQSFLPRSTALYWAPPDSSP